MLGYNLQFFEMKGKFEKNNQNYAQIKQKFEKDNQNYTKTKKCYVILKRRVLDS